MPHKPVAWWTLYYACVEHAQSQDHACAMADGLYAAIEPFLKKSAKKEPK